MTPNSVRRAVLAVCAVAIAGMIVSSIADRDGAAITFGLVAAVAVMCQIVATAVGSPAGTADVEDLGRRVEEGVAELVRGGADEVRLRATVRDAVRLGAARTSQAVAPRR